MYNIKFNSEFGIYIHIPFCKRKCNYCDFYSRPYCRAKMENYISALKKEIEVYAGMLNYRKIKTVYFGGGTPGLLTPAEAAEILEYINRYFSPENDMEITIEANPSSLSEDKIIAYHQCGINRLSLGVQSLNNRELALLGRMHSAEEALNVIELVKQEYNNFNVDLIFAIPGQSCSNWLYTLNRIVRLQPKHISTYNLEVHEDTPLGKKVKKGELVEISEELDAKMYMQTVKSLQDAGYEQYEISSFALPGYEARHNKIYWRFQPYLGLGPSAHSFDSCRRFYNYADTDRYIKKLDEGILPVQEIVSLTEEDLMAEMLIMGLRLIDGVRKDEFYDKFGICIENVYQEEINDLVQQKLLINTGEKILLSKKGLLLGNQVFMGFLKT